MALKTESIGLAIATELPLIVINAQRAGPSTGMPTKTEQSDLYQAVFGRNADSPLVVLAARSPADCFDAAIEAVRLATRYMTPVILLTDGYLANASEPWAIPDLDHYEPFPVKFADDPDGFLPYRRDPQTLARPWARPGVPGLEHRIARLLGIRDYSRRNLTVYNYDIYLEEDTDEVDEWRWRIKNDEGEIIFSSSMHYHSKEEAEQEMWITVSLAWNPENYDLRLTEDEEEFYVNLIDQDGEVVARHMDYFDSREEAEAQIQSITEYMFNRVTREGMFVFEHILFRPDGDDPDAGDKFMKICMDPECVQCQPADPYSLRLTFVFPGWTERFSNIYFREYAEKVIRREVPAHILCRICWIGNTAETEEGEETTEEGQMAQLQTLYKQWLIEKMNSPEDQKENEHLKPLVDLLHDLETVYPEGRLYDCEEAGEEEPKPSIILGKSTIGELKQDDNGDE
jgi:uncharacterized protein YegP (UPF0339 family)